MSSLRNSAALWLFAAASVAQLLACGGDDGNSATPTGSGGGTPIAVPGTGGSGQAQTGPAAGQQAPATGTGRVGTGGSVNGPTGQAGSGNSPSACVEGGACSIDLESLGQRAEAQLQCDSATSTCYCSPSEASLGRLAGGTLEGRWVCVSIDDGSFGFGDDRNQGGSRNWPGDDGRNQGGSSNPVWGSGRGGNRNPVGVGVGGSQVGTPPPAAGGSVTPSTSTPEACPASAPAAQSPCTTDGYFCWGCMCAGGVWSCL